MVKKESEPADKVEELIKLRSELTEYFGYLGKAAQDERLNKEEERHASQLFHSIGYKSGYLGKLIFDLTNETKVDVGGKQYNMWGVALRIPIDKLAWHGTGFCIQVVNRAIGQLVNDITSGIRDKKTGKRTSPVGKLKLEIPKAFIAHGGRSGILDKLREFIEALGIKPIIVELSPSRGMTVDEKVSKYIKDADFGIVLATKGGIIDTKGKETKQHPRLNVIDELERLRAAFPDKTILLLEKGVDLPSNISGLTHEPFVGQSMDRAFTAIARELVELGILRATKPQE